MIGINKTGFLAVSIFAMAGTTGWCNAAEADSTVTAARARKLPGMEMRTPSDWAAITNEVDMSKEPAWMRPDPAALKRWQEMRFGLFIHWGPCSLTESEISWQRGRKIPTEVYDNLYKEFNPTNFNAGEWVDLARSAGMKYLVITTKHHDGFCLWDTKLTDYNIMNTPFHRDVLKELSEACKQQGIAFGTYYSVCDWYNTNFPHYGSCGHLTRTNGNLEAYNQYLLGQIKELITGYGPLITLWGDQPHMFRVRGRNTIKLARELQPDILINNRFGEGGDYTTPEGAIGSFFRPGAWETCGTISGGGHWSWNGTNDIALTLQACLENLVRCAGNNGNYLLDVGPRPDGRISPEQTERLKEIGGWMRQYGETIYATHGGPFMPGKSYASTCKGNTVYLHIVDWPTEVLRLPALPARIVASQVLTGGKLELEQAKGELRIRVAVSARHPIDTIIKLELDKPALELASLAPLKHEELPPRPKKPAKKPVVKHGAKAATNAVNEAVYDFNNGASK